MVKSGLFVMIDSDTDDHEFFEMALNDISKSSKSLFFPDCESALAHFSQKSGLTPDYVFIDINLPKIQGDQCLEQLQRLQEFDHPCIVIYSTSLPDEWKPRLSEIGVDKFVEKTGSVSALAAQIHALMQND